VQLVQSGLNIFSDLIAEATYEGLKRSAEDRYKWRVWSQTISKENRSWT